MTPSIFRERDAFHAAVRAAATCTIVFQAEGSQDGELTRLALQRAMPKHAAAAAKRKGKTHAGVKPVNKRQKESDKKGTDDEVGKAAEKQIIYCLENPEGRTIVMNQATLTSHLMSGWALRYQCKNIEEGLAWTNASKMKDSEDEDEEDVNGDEEEAEEDANDVSSEEQEDEETRGSPVKTQKHTHWCNRDRLYYRTYGEVAAVKKRLNDQQLKKLGLAKSAAKMKVAAVSLPKSKGKSVHKKKKKAPQTKLRRSTRVVPSDASPNYADPDEEEEMADEEDEDEEDASDFEQEGQEDGEDSGEEGENKDNGTVSDDDDEATIAVQMGAWGARFLELVAYREEHGHCNASRYDAKNKSLGKWVNHQRVFYNKWTQGEKTQMTENKIAMLNRIGFRWGKTRAEPQVPWNTRFEELKEHLENFGSCDDLVQSDYNKYSGLGKWISWQRRLFYLMKTGKALRKLSKEQIKLLNGIGFNWDGPYHGQKKFNGTTTEK